MQDQATNSEMFQVATLSEDGLDACTQFLNSFLQDQAINSEMFQEAALSEYDS